MNTPTDDVTPDADHARELLSRAEAARSTARAAASWPNIAGLAGLGGASSLGLVALAFAPVGMTWLPMVLLGIWIAGMLALGFRFGRSVKQGFGHRWALTMSAWGLAWIIGVFGVTIWFEGQTWFLAAASTALSLVTLGGAWWEASR